MNIQEIQVKSKFVQRLLEHPNKPHLAVFGAHSAMKLRWQEAYVELRPYLERGLEFVTSHHDYYISTPDGGSLRFVTVFDRPDLSKIRGYEIASFFVENMDHGTFRNEVIMTLKCRVRVKM